MIQKCGNCKKQDVTTLKLFAVACCLGSEDTNELKLENISLFSSFEMVSWKISS